MFNRVFRNLLIVLFLIVLTGCQNRYEKQSKYSETKLLMGTIVRVDTCANDNSSQVKTLAYSQMWERLEEISWRMNVFDEKSDVSRINQSYPDSAKVKADTYEIIARSQDFSRLTNGAFEITVWPLIKLWKESAKKNSMPSLSEVEEAKSAVGANRYVLEGSNQVRTMHKDTRLDLGGNAKGYAIDEAARILRANKIQNFFIDAGGDVYVGGKNCVGKKWRVGIRDPRFLNKIFDVVNVSNMAVTTSGNYEQFIEIKGKKFSHIIDPQTGFPQKDVVSATVIAKSAEEADVYSTALCVLGAKKGTDLINQLGGSFSSMILLKKDEGQIEKFLSKRYTTFQDK
ncbi:hypothetical protein MNBD_BACTEROID05-963 [hydrothermal vent metagenome]|uniref:FAD:protein FMN transferase n=1 Tax=hydrothermal vent metagenome TaxID=652676 RepID=A0A3B0TK87_9ZZZZ